MISDSDIAEFAEHSEIDSKVLVQKFWRPLKAFFNLYNFFRLGMSDVGFMDGEDPELKIPRGFWTNPGSRKMDRSRLLKEGFERYGSPSQPKAVSDANPERTKRIWPIFLKIVRKI